MTLWYRAPEVLLGATHYAPAVDIWSVACIFAELARKQAIFPGDSELQQLLHIFKLLGTPSEEIWPGVTKLRDWHEFPSWQAQDLAKVFPRLDAAGIDLMKQMFEYDPANRCTVSAQRAAGRGGGGQHPESLPASQPASQGVFTQAACQYVRRPQPGCPRPL